MAAEKACARVGNFGWRVYPTFYLGSGHHRLEAAGSGELPEPGLPHRNCLLRDPDAFQFQSSHSARWLLPAERLARDTKPETQGIQIHETRNSSLALGPSAWHLRRETQPQGKEDLLEVW